MSSAACSCSLALNARLTYSRRFAYVTGIEAPLGLRTRVLPSERRMVPHTLTDAQQRYGNIFLAIYELFSQRGNTLHLAVCKLSVHSYQIRAYRFSAQT
eukprot:1355817-Amorphochlora_amoeboformis.AAC.1